jgi:hypothetical protein
MLKNALLLLIFNYAIWYLDKLMRNSSVFYTVEINKQSKMAALKRAGVKKMSTLVYVYTLIVYLPG